MKLSHKELVKLGRIEADKGDSLNKIEADFMKKGVPKKDALKALDEVDYYNKIEKSKHKEAPKDNKEAVAGKQQVGGKPASGKRSLFWPLLILFLVVGAIVYLFYSGRINLDWLRSINFK